MNVSPSNTELNIKKSDPNDLVVALAGNPNVGKSTVFNQLTGMRQHTGNWPGKTVCNAWGYCSYQGQGYVLVDIPGCYSLLAQSADEEAARDFLCNDGPDAVAVVCDAVCLERNLNLVLQILEVTNKVVVCVNLMDEAKRKKIYIDLDMMSKSLRVPVIGMTARKNRGLSELFESLEIQLNEKEQISPGAIVSYPDYVEEAIKELEPEINMAFSNTDKNRWLSVKILTEGSTFLESFKEEHSLSGDYIKHLYEKVQTIHNKLADINITKECLNDDIAAAFIKKAEYICKGAVQYMDGTYNEKDRKLDRLFTSKRTGFPIMFLILLFIFWLTIVGANYPSEWLSSGLFWIENRLYDLFLGTKVPRALYEMLILGGYRVLAWVISVMLPPMAIFFPLFTILEDYGYLPRVAFNLDHCFKKCCSCGKQALTMCMEF